MHPGLQTRFERMEKKREAFLDFLSKFDNETLNRPLEPGRWSPIQYMHHLLKAETGSMRYMAKKREYPDKLTYASWWEGIKGPILQLTFWAPIKIKAPKVVADVPPSGNLEEVKNLWNLKRSELKFVLETYPEDMMKAKIMKHFASGRITLDQLLLFFEHHADRHFGQIKKVLKV